MELEVEEESDLWGPHVSEWRGKHTKHVCTNTVTVGVTPQVFIKDKYLF
jgi:hypothetical protein